MEGAIRSGRRRGRRAARSIRRAACCPEWSGPTSGRIVAFTDGVMAVAITLLVLNIEVPDVDTMPWATRSWDLVPSCLRLLLAFALVGRFWVIHHNRSRRSCAFDGRLMVLNLVFLALIA